MLAHDLMYNGNNFHCIVLSHSDSSGDRDTADNDGSSNDQ